MNSQGLPIRKSAKDCEFFLKTGSCKYGLTCKFNHPEVGDATANDTKNGKEADGKQSKGDGETKQENSKSEGVTEGEDSKQQAKDKSSYAGMGTLQLNDKGFPKRPGNPPCSFYMKNGNCKFGVSCRYDHPDNVTPSMPGGGPIGKGKKTQSNMPAAAYNSKGYPIRPDASDCAFYLKTQECKYGNQCRFNHPEGVSSGVRLSPMGYPLRAGTAACAFYMKTGQCKFGLTCKFDHPVSGSRTCNLN
mmetsp:Transcript_17062/g.34555  ORF Transcript_17062/g.34555 Transcript_17062/m.34555 type:complete len:246 (-) Transcript_17062:400-1137(-)